MGIVHCHELGPAFHQARDEGYVARQAIKLGDDQHGTTPPAQIERGDELRPVVLPAAFNLRELLDQLATASDVAGDGRPLGIEAETALPLAGG